MCSISALSVAQSTIFYFVIAVLSATRTIAQGIQVTAPPGATVCESFSITWTGGTGPYILSIDDSSNGRHIYSAQNILGNNAEFQSFVTAVSAIITIIDSLSNIGTSSPFAISPGNQSCISSTSSPSPSSSPSSILVSTPEGATVCQYFPVMWTGGTGPFILRLDDTSKGLNIFTDTNAVNANYSLESAISAASAVITIIDSTTNIGRSSPFVISGPPGVQNCSSNNTTTSISPSSTLTFLSTSSPTLTSIGSNTIATYTPATPSSPSSGTTNSTVNADDARVVTNGSAWRSDSTNCSSTTSKVSKKCTNAGASLNFAFDGMAVYMWTSLGQSSGTYSVALDNRTAVSIDGFSQNPACVVSWSAFGLADGKHTVVVTNLGQSQKASSNGQQNATIFELDAFIITTSSKSNSKLAMRASNTFYFVIATTLLLNYGASWW